MHIFILLLIQMLSINIIITFMQSWLKFIHLCYFANKLYLYTFKKFYCGESIICQGENIEHIFKIFLYRYLKLLNILTHS